MGIDSGEPKHPWRFVIMLALVMLVSHLNRHVFVLLITPIKQSANLSDTQVSLLIGSAFVIPYLLAGIPLASLADRGNRKQILMAGIIVWSSGTAAFAAASSFVALAGARIAQGVGSSLNAPLSFSIIGDLFHRERLARPIAVLNIGGAVGTGLAMVLGSLLYRWVGGLEVQTLPILGSVEPWQVTLLWAAILGPLVAVLIAMLVAEPRRRVREKNSAEPGFRETVRHLVRYRSAHLPLMLGAGINSTLVVGLLVWTPSLMERNLGWAVGTPGPYLGLIVLLVGPLGLFCGGWLADQRAALGDEAANMRIAVRACLGLAPVAILYPLMPFDWLALGSLSLLFFFAMMGLAPANAAVQRITPDSMRGTITAIYVTALNVLGYGLGPLLVALLTDGLFLSEAKLAQALALFAAILAPAGLAINVLALRQYGRTVSELTQSGQ